MLAIGVLGGTALAQRGDTNGDSPLKSFASRVASILGLDEAVVQDALGQATREMQDEAMQTKLERQVECGRLTQEQADEYYQWYQSKPESMTPGFGQGFQGHGFGKGPAGGHMWGGMGRHGSGFWKGAAPAPTPENPTGTSSSGASSF